MNNYGKIAIVAALALVVAAVLIAKQAHKAPSPGAEGKSETASGTGGESSGQAASPERNKLPRLVDLGAGKCIPCKMMTPILEELKNEYKGQMEVEFIDVWENPKAGDEYGIEGIPTQIFYDPAGKELYRHAGFYAKEDILAKCKELGFDLKAK